MKISVAHFLMQLIPIKFPINIQFDSALAASLVLQHSYSHQFKPIKVSVATLKNF